MDCLIRSLSPERVDWMSSRTWFAVKELRSMFDYIAVVEDYNTIINENQTIRFINPWESFCLGFDVPSWVVDELLLGRMLKGIKAASTLEFAYSCAYFLSFVEFYMFLDFTMISLLYIYFWWCCVINFWYVTFRFPIYVSHSSNNWSFKVIFFFNLVISRS